MTSPQEGSSFFQWALIFIGAAAAVSGLYRWFSDAPNNDPRRRQRPPDIDTPQKPRATEVDRIAVDWTHHRERISRRSVRSDFTVSLLPVNADDVPEVVHANEHYFSSALGSGATVYIGYTPAVEWINVHTRKRRHGDVTGHYTGDYHEYGFSRRRNSWSYGVAPAGATEIRDVIQAVVAYMERR